MAEQVLDSRAERAEHICQNLSEWERGRVSRAAFKQLIIDALIVEAQDAKHAQREADIELICPARKSVTNWQMKYREMLRRAPLVGETREGSTK
mgnify:CR=1 FL=1